MPDDLLHTALSNLEAENFTAAIPALTALSKEGSVEAMYWLGIAGLEQNCDIAPAEAFAWLKKAADQGHSEACHKIAQFECQINFKSPLTSAERLTFLKQAAALGNADAQYRVAELYSTGEWENARISIDLVQALEMYKKAAEQGHEDALYELGWVYLNGEGTTIDETAAEAFFIKAANQGHPVAKQVLDDLFSDAGNKGLV